VARVRHSRQGAKGVFFDEKIRRSSSDVGLCRYRVWATCAGGHPCQSTSPRAFAKLQGKEANATLIANQMMVTIMERMKIGALDEAREIAMGMVKGHEAFSDTPAEHFRSLLTRSSAILYERELAQRGETPKVTLVEQPIADGFYFLAMIDFQQGKADSALENLQKAIHWDPVRSAFYAERGFMLLKQNKPSELALVMAAYLRALDLANSEGDFAHALRGLGYVFIERGDFEAAMACYLRSLDYEPEHAAAKAQMDFIRQLRPALRTGFDAGRAAAILKERQVPARIGTVHVQVLLTMADELQKGNELEAARAVLERAKKLEPKNAEVQRRLTGLPAAKKTTK
jgi:tetratricopeptide (TPR) repeat protein